MRKEAKMLLCALIGAIAGTAVSGRILGKAADKVKKMSDKHLELYLLMNQWVAVKQEGKNLSDYFKRKGYQNIAIYGMGYIGQTLVKELKGTDIIVKYAIDKKANELCSDLPVITPDSVFPEVDVMVVTPVTFFNEIKKNLSGRGQCPIVSIKDLLYEI